MTLKSTNLIFGARINMRYPIKSQYDSKDLRLKHLMKNLFRETNYLNLFPILGVIFNKDDQYLTGLSINICGN